MTSLNPAGNNVVVTATIDCPGGIIRTMKSAAGIGTASLGITFIMGVGLALASGQTPPKSPARTVTPPSIQSNAGKQTAAAPTNQTSSSNQTATKSASQTRGANMISSAEMEHIQQLSAELGLTQGQFSQIVNIVNQAHISDNAVNTNTALTPAQKHQKLAAIKRLKRSQIDAVLTPAQRARLEAIEKGG